MNTNNQTAWFIAGLIFISLLAMYAPRFGGAILILITLVLALEAANKHLV